MGRHMQNLTVSLIQDEIVANNPEANLDLFSEKICSIVSSDLIILPEVFTTGFCAGARNYAEVKDGRAYAWMAQQAQQSQAVITGSLVVKEGDSYYNRLIFMRPNGQYEEYNKRHLFRMAGEHLRYVQGDERLIVTLKGWRILPQICYDLRFPVWSRNQDDYDFAFYTANWPSARSSHWRSLLQARAIENLSYVAGVNRVGCDEANQIYAGHSSIYGPDGIRLLESERQDVLTHILDADVLRAYRESFPAHLDKDRFRLTV